MKSVPSKAYKSLFGSFGEVNIMNQFILTCCSTADRTREFFSKNNIPFACFHYQIDGKEYDDDLGITISAKDFFDQIAKGATPVTSQVNSQQYLEMWEPFLKEGKDILHLSLSSGISGSINSAYIAKDELMNKYPERTVEVIDSLCASGGYGLLVEYVAELRDQGKTLQEAKKWVLENRNKLHHWFFSSDLTSFRRGGRITGTEAMLGTLLGICPLMNVNHTGHLIPRKKVRTKKRVIEEMVNEMKQHAVGGIDYNGKCLISHSACYEDALKVKELVEANMPALKDKVSIGDIGTVIGSHTGPGTVALFFMGDERTE